MRRQRSGALHAKTTDEFIHVLWLFNSRKQNNWVISRNHNERLRVMILCLQTLISGLQSQWMRLSRHHQMSLLWLRKPSWWWTLVRRWPVRRFSLSLRRIRRNLRVGVGLQRVIVWRWILRWTLISSLKDTTKLTRWWLFISGFWTTLITLT